MSGRGVAFRFRIGNAVGLRCGGSRWISRHVPDPPASRSTLSLARPLTTTEVHHPPCQLIWCPTTRVRQSFPVMRCSGAFSLSLRHCRFLYDSVSTPLDMDSDPISEATPKRRKTESGYQSVPRTWDSDNDSGDELFNEFDQQNTVATLPLQSSSRDPPTQLKRPGAGTQPTQILGTPKKHLNPLSSPPPSVQVARSSPPAASSPTSSLPAEPALKPKPQQNGRPGGLLASVMAPPGTAFRRPVGVQKKPPVIDLSDDDDAPIEHSSDEDTQPMKSTIRPTEFTRGGRGLNSSPNWVEDSPRQQNSQERFKSITSQFKYGQSANISSANNPSDDMASAYGGVSRTKQKVPSRQAGPARAQPVDMTIDDLTDLDVRKKVERILLITPGKPIQQMLDALAKKHGNADDAIEYLLNEDDKHLQQLLSSKMGKPQQHIDLTLASSDIEKGVAKPAARPVAKVPPPRPMAKQEVKAPTRTIQEKYSSTQRLSIPKPAADLADVAATPATNAELIVSKRPFRNLDAVRAVSDAKPNAKTGRKSTKKAIGEKIVDICEEMFTGYEAVDDLVAKCEALGKPIAETMKKWGLDLQEAARSGELNLTTLEETQDSGIGTPSSSVNFGDDDDIKPVSTKSGKSAFLKQPSIMSTDLQMKDYQLVGLNWLNLLWTKRLSCILADDMGLGKTCQVISFLAHLRETGVPGVHLVVVPGSTLENWLREFNRFCPALRVEPYYGSQATREEMRYSIEEDLDDIDVIVTTYETAANNRVDTKFLSKLRPTLQSAGGRAGGE
ncbi:DNA-dependent ATPase fun30 [Zalaria obscura]|uniref:DNA-dependent ATPase fun30 n=1 Tax=Zalaria obscura TaxID=2024903 RepID=A0ACC3SDQ5_9PEZI